MLYSDRGCTKMKIIIEAGDDTFDGLLTDFRESFLTDFNTFLENSQISQTQFNEMRAESQSELEMNFRGENFLQWTNFLSENGFEELQ